MIECSMVGSAFEVTVAECFRPLDGIYSGFNVTKSACFS